MTERFGGTKRSALSVPSASLKKTREKGKAISYSDKKTVLRIEMFLALILLRGIP
jgi:hypothetical protein